MLHPAPREASAPSAPSTGSAGYHRLPLRTNAENETYRAARLHPTLQDTPTCTSNMVVSNFDPPKKAYLPYKRIGDTPRCRSRVDFRAFGEGRSSHRSDYSPSTRPRPWAAVPGLPRLGRPRFCGSVEPVVRTGGLGDWGTGVDRSMAILQGSRRFARRQAGRPPELVRHARIAVRPVWAESSRIRPGSERLARLARWGAESRTVTRSDDACLQSRAGRPAGPRPSQPRQAAARARAGSGGRTDR